MQILSDPPLFTPADLKYLLFQPPYFRDIYSCFNDKSWLAFISRDLRIRPCDQAYLPTLCPYLALPLNLRFALSNSLEDGTYRRSIFLRHDRLNEGLAQNLHGTETGA